MVGQAATGGRQPGVGWSILNAAVPTHPTFLPTVCRMNPNCSAGYRYARTFTRTGLRCQAPARGQHLSSCQDPVHPAATGPACRRAASRGGFTLLELLLVLAILVVLGGIVLVNFGGAQADANVNATLTQLNSLKQSVQMYQIRLNSLPQSLDELKDGPSDSAKKARWTGPIIDRIPDDAWGNPIKYERKGNGFELRSGGLDGQLNTDDDLTVQS